VAREQAAPDRQNARGVPPDQTRRLALPALWGKGSAVPEGGRDLLPGGLPEESRTHRAREAVSSAITAVEIQLVPMSA